MKYFLSIFFLCPIFFSAQAAIRDIFKNIGIGSIDPSGKKGKIRAIDVVEKTFAIYLVMANGCNWCSKRGEINWKPLFDKQALQNSGAIAVLKNNKRNSQMTNVDDAIKTIIKDKAKIPNDSRKYLYTPYNRFNYFVGYEHVKARLNNILYETGTYIISSVGQAIHNAQLNPIQCKAQTKKITNCINRFFLDDWLSYQNFVLNSRINLFKSFSPIIIDK